MRVKDLEGLRFGHVTVLRRAPNKLTPSGSVKAYWVCICDCGKEFERAAQPLVHGSNQSCGCVRNQATAERNLKHGACGTPTHSVWLGIIDRCYNQTSTAYPNYGGRGVTVCASWRKNFLNFLSDMGEKPNNNMTIERKDNRKGYSPSNCKWLPKEQQSINRRNTKWIIHNGITDTQAGWSRRLGVCHGTIRYRLRRGIYTATTAPKLQR